jgi:hypothetical protein
MTKDYTFGADPEVFSIGKFADIGVISPALLVNDGAIQIGIHDPELKHPIFYKNRDFSWMMDGVAWELTLLKAYDNIEEMYKVIEKALTFLEGTINDLRYQGYNLRLVNLPAVKFRPDLYVDYLDNQLVYQGAIFGCDKDYDAINPQYECETLDVLNHQWRYGGGHTHLGVKDLNVLQKIHEDETERIKLVQLMAIFAGNNAIKFAKAPHLEVQRASLYGRPGRYRPQPWGIEYRTPSNNWTLSLEATVGVFEGMIKAVEAYKKDMWKELTDNFLERTIDNIINCEVEDADKLLKELK